MTEGNGMENSLNKLMNFAEKNLVLIQSHIREKYTNMMITMHLVAKNETKVIKTT
jgi:hypothetical protein